MPHGRSAGTRSLGIVMVAVACAALAPGGGHARPARRAPAGEVDLPLAEWSALRERLAPAPAPRPPLAASFLSRTLVGRFQRGLLSAELTLRFELHVDGATPVPLCARGTSVESVLLDGKPAALRLGPEGASLVVDRRGRHEAKLKILVGQEQDDFARRIRAVLPEGGPTAFSILIPEREIDARLEEGVLTAETRRGEGTLLEGQLGGGVLELRWARRLRHRGPGPARIDARVTTLLSVDESLIQGLTVLDLSIREGETDRIDLALPRGLEPVKVTGDAVLQWQAASKRGQLAVLLRYLARGQTRIVVHTLQPGGGAGPIAAPLLLPPAGATVSGSVGIVAPTSLELQVATRSGRRLEARDLPPELTALSRRPILAGFAHSAEPGLTIALARRQQVSLTSTLCDELHAATVLTAEGREATKLRLHLRNNTRQYLTVRLPDGASLTHAQLDGQPIRPARSREELLFPLRQSERIGEGERLHTVLPGQTLGDLAHFYYSDPERWRPILEANRHQLRDERGLRAGQRLRIPHAGKLTIEESSFVLELAYRREGAGLGIVGRRQLVLPSLDVDTMAVHWHLYLPGAVTPLRFDANLTQRSALRYDPFRRARDFLRRALGERDAWAGEYRSILSRRKTIFRSDAAARGSREAAPASFPLVGVRYRFARILAAREQPTLRVLYARSEAVTVARVGALLTAAGLLLLLLLRPGRASALCVAAAGVPLLVLGHHLPGVHHALLLGALAGATVAHLLRLRARRGARPSDPARPTLREVAWSPWLAARWISLRSLALCVGLAGAALFALRFPLLLSATVLALLLLAWWRGGQLAGEPIQAANEEASHDPV